MTYTVEQLYQVRKLVIELFKSPRGRCTEASLMMSDRTGLSRICGYFMTDKKDMLTHAWNYDPEKGLYIDLTADQFDSGLPPVFIAPVNSYKARNHISPERYAEMEIGFI